MIRPFFVGFSMSGIILFILAVVGASGIIAQMVLARELLVSFSGNELALGLVLANWMLAESLGVFLAGRFAAKGKQVALTFAGLQVAFSFFLLIALFVARAYKGMIGVGVGEGLGWWQALWWSFLILLPVAFTHGAMFSIGCQLTVGVKVTYVWETVGTLLGGLLLTYVLLPFISSFQIVLLIAGLGVVALVILFLKRGQRVAMICLLAVGCCLLLGLFKSADILEKTSLKQQWKTGLLLASRNSVYGNIVALKHNNQCTFYYNGVPAITTPHPDAVFIEEMGIVPLLFVDQPKRILVLGSGAGGLLSELLKHPIEKIDYVELDSVLIDLVKTYATPKTTDALYDARVNLVHQDPRLFLKKATEWYDVIIIGTSFSNDYATNRFFTQEFFSLCLKRLDRQGVFALWLPGSPAYLSDEVRDLTGSVVNALKQSGCFVRVIPGDYHLLISALSADLVAVDVSVLSKRFSERSLTTKMLSVEYLNFRLNPKRLESFNRAFASHTHKANRDFMPYAVFVFSLLRSKEFSPSFALWQESIINHRRLIAVIVVFFCVICVLWLRNKHKKYFYFSTTVAIATTGFVAMLITLILLFSFQVIFGYIYHQLGFLISLFMAGTALGAACVSWSKYSIDRYYHYLVITELAIMLACLGVACALVWFSTVFLLPFSFPTLFVMFGILVGCEFSLAGALYSFRRQAQGGIAGTLYAADLIGGWVAGVLGSTFLLTFVGLPQTCFLMAGLKLANFALLAHKKAGTR